MFKKIWELLLLLGILLSFGNIEHETWCNNFKGFTTNDKDEFETQRCKKLWNLHQIWW
jgi:hypothetical protein